MVNVRKAVAKKTLIATKAQAESVEKNLKAQAEAGKVAKPVAVKKAAAGSKKVSVKNKSTGKIKAKLKDQQTKTPLGGLSGAALIKHHQARVEFLRKHPEENKSIHPKGLRAGSSARSFARQRVNQQALRAIHIERDKSDTKGNVMAGQWAERHRAISLGLI